MYDILLLKIWKIYIYRRSSMKKAVTLSIKNEVNDKLDNLSKETGYTKSMIVSLLIEKLAEGKIQLI